MTNLQPYITFRSTLYHCRTFISILCLLFISSGALNGQISFYSVVSESRVSEDQTFQVQYVVEGAKRVERFINPEFPGFKVVEIFEIPLAPRLNPFTRKTVEAYTRVAVLSPTKPGKFTISGAQAVVDGKSMKSNRVKVEVLKSGTSFYGEAQVPEVEDESEIKPGETIEQKIRDNFFLTSQVNKSSCFVGEPLMAVYKACSRLNANSHVVKRPSLTGFSVVEMVDTYDGQATVEVIRGKPFYVHLIRKVQLFPLQAGTYQLEGAEVESVINFVKTKSLLGSSRDLQELMDKIHSPEPPTIIPHQLNLTTKPLTITVKPLPERGQPNDFSGAVGNFKLAAKVENETTGKGGQIRLAFTVSGTGNFPLVTAPEIVWPTGVEVADGGVDEQANPYVYPLSGSKTFTFLISSDQAGSKTIPAATFNYFDPEKEQYVQLTSKPLLVMFKDSPSPGGGTDLGPTSASSSKIPKHYLWFIPVVLIIVACIIYFSFFSGKLKVELAEKPEELNVKVIPNRLTSFAAADFALANNDQKAFYENIQQVLWNVAAEVCNVPPSGLNKHNVATLLKQKSVPVDTVAEFNMVLNECEWALYTPDTTPTDMIAMKQKAERLFEELHSVKS